MELFCQLNYLEGFEVKITRLHDVVMVHGVDVDFGNLYSSDWLAVHGPYQMLLLLDECSDEAPAAF